METRPRQIFAMSNSSAFFVEPQESPLFAEYLKSLTGKNRPIICHVGAANGDTPEKVDKFFALSRRVGFEPKHLNLFALESDDPATFFANVDVVYVDGGSTRNLRALLFEWAADEAIRQAYKRGIVIAGASAGANILFEWGMTDSVRARIDAIAGLGILTGSISVHADVRNDRNEALEKHLRSKDAAFPAYALDDGTALHFVDGVLNRVVSSKSTGKVALIEALERRRELPVFQPKIALKSE